MSAAKVMRRAGRGAAALFASCLILAPAAGAVAPAGALDARAWELVSPSAKNGGETGAPGTPQAGITGAAAQGGALAFGSASSFGQAQGSLPVNQYIARRGASSWSTENITPPALSGTYAGGAYELLSADLGSAVLSSGDRCRDGSLSCEAENPPLGPGGPAGYRNLYLHQADTYTPLITTTNSPSLSLSAGDFHLFAAGGSPSLNHVVISTCAALRPDALEVPASEGCDPTKQNLYEWGGGALRTVNLLPGESTSAPGAALVGPGAVSADGSHIYWSHAGNLYLREGVQTKLAAEGASFQGASSDGSLAFYLEAEHLYRYDAATEASTDLTPGGGVAVLLGASDDGATIYYVASDGLYLRAGATTTKLSSAAPALLPPAAGIARASADGRRLFFDSAAKLLGADTNASPDVYEWEASGAGSCIKAAGCLGLISDGRSTGAALTGASATGDDVFFATATALLPADHDGALDIYDARAGGGLPEAAGPPCVGDDCPDPAPAPEYKPPPTATLTGRPNPPLSFKGEGHRKKHKHKKKHHRSTQRHHKGARR